MLRIKKEVDLKEQLKEKDIIKKIKIRYWRRKNR